eukprot:CAMPEP_0118709730 /NCGR_PEP_ID=MMETSP0800-20121206/22862_1 /TAXON_ID=210618 ORGANISM="Striatella unipunctata, Strain CCMP2910" /NCGR_SAMPLE_ID=MMETSP0800 /ASSEMBLY_ACC=CAM_ASM_000638 /LENGTH=266 /DNA_ID=CAMNT_0006613581 /DNA_START=26 /DNA_END=826 /DNA_ORIENTATION=-
MNPSSPTKQHSSRSHLMKRSPSIPSLGDCTDLSSTCSSSRYSSAKYQDSCDEDSHCGRPSSIDIIHFEEVAEEEVESVHDVVSLSDSMESDEFVKEELSPCDTESVIRESFRQVENAQQRLNDMQKILETIFEEGDDDPSDLTTRREAKRQAELTEICLGRCEEMEFELDELTNPIQPQPEQPKPSKKQLKRRLCIFLGLLVLYKVMTFMVNKQPGFKLVDSLPTNAGGTYYLCSKSSGGDMLCAPYTQPQSTCEEQKPDFCKASS